MRVLIACEFSGALRDRFFFQGHDAWSVDLPGVAPEGIDLTRHIQADAFDVIEALAPWDLLIAHPPCTYLARSGLHWNLRDPRRVRKTAEALEFVQRLLDADVPRIALENPVGCISSRIRKPDQVLQPYQFGDDASKLTCLWLKGLPPLIPGTRFPGRLVEWPPGSGKTVERWSNQLDSGQSAHPDSRARAALRSRTYPGVADAMADQWGTP